MKPIQPMEALKQVSQVLKEIQRLDAMQERLTKESEEQAKKQRMWAKEMEQWKAGQLTQKPRRPEIHQPQVVDYGDVWTQLSRLGPIVERAIAQNADQTAVEMPDIPRETEEQEELQTSHQKLEALRFYLAQWVIRCPAMWSQILPNIEKAAAESATIANRLNVFPISEADAVRKQKERERLIKLIQPKENKA